MKKGIKKYINLFHDMDKPLFYITVLFFLFGLLAIVSASSREAVVRYGATLYHYFFKQGAALIIGFIIFLIIINIDTKKYNFFGIVAYIIVLLGLLYLLICGSSINGAKNWISFPGLGSIQPSEFAKPAIIILISIMYEKYYNTIRNRNNNDRIKVFVLLLAIILIPTFLIFLSKDLGTMAILVFIFMMLFITSPILRLDKLKIIGFSIALIGVALIGIYTIKGYVLTDAQKSRLNFIDPCSNYATGGYQVCNGFIAINDGGLFGLGIGKSKQKYSYLSEPHTDSIFAIISEELGFLKCSIIFIGYIVVLLRILSLSSKASTIRGKYICLGVASYLFIHIFLNLGGIFGSIPLTGVPLPFLSYGGSSVLSLCISLSMVQRVAIETKRKKIKI